MIYRDGLAHAHDSARIPLQFFESAENVRATLARTTGRTPSARKSKDIATFIQQGRMYFDAADQSPIEIRPLILYYGMMAFAKAVIVARGPRNAEALPQRHGLDDGSEFATRLLNLQVKIGDEGTFQEFNDVIAPREGLKYIEASMSKSHAMPTASSANLVGVELTLKQIFGNCACVADLYETTCSESSSKLMYTLFLHGAPTEQVDLRVDVKAPLANKDELREIVTRCRNDFTDLNNWRFREAVNAWDHAVLLFDNGTSNIDELTDGGLRESMNGYTSIQPAEPLRDFRTLLSRASSSLAVDHNYFSAPINGLHISEISLQYIGIFLLGSLVRYRPQTWVHATTRFANSERPADDSALALVDGFMNEVRTRFPALTVRLLTRP